MKLIVDVELLEEQYRLLADHLADANVRKYHPLRGLVAMLDDIVLQLSQQGEVELVEERSALDVESLGRFEHEETAADCFLVTTDGAGGFEVWLYHRCPRDDRVGRLHCDGCDSTSCRHVFAVLRWIVDAALQTEPGVDVRFTCGVRAVRRDVEHDTYEVTASLPREDVVDLVMQRYGDDPLLDVRGR